MPKNTQKRELRRVVQTMNVENNFCYQNLFGWECGEIYNIV